MRILLFLLLAMVSGCGRATDIRALSLRLTLEAKDGVAICAGTPLSADTFSTAAHCMRGKRLVGIDGAEATAIKVTPDGTDRVVVTLLAPMFKRWAVKGTAKVGDRVRFYGHPKGVPFVYREGRVVYVGEGLIAVDVTICHGDSGAGLFNDRGQWVGVVSRMAPEVAPCQFMVAQ